MAIPDSHSKLSWQVLAVLFVVCPVAYVTSAIFIPPPYTIFMQPFFFLIPSLWFRKKYFAEEAVQSPKMGMGLGLTLAIFATLAVSLAFNFSLPTWLEMMGQNQEELEKLFAPLLHKGSFLGFLWDVFLLAVIPAVCEEYFFRGALQKGLGVKIGNVTASFVVAVFFAIYHLNPWFLPFYFLLGLWFSFLYVKTSRLGPAVLAHFINNAVGVTLYHYWE